MRDNRYKFCKFCNDSLVELKKKYTSYQLEKDFGIRRGRITYWHTKITKGEQMEAKQNLDTMMKKAFDTIFKVFHEREGDETWLAFGKAGEACNDTTFKRALIKKPNALEDWLKIKTSSCS